jgi:hypothetical protein
MGILEKIAEIEKEISRTQKNKGKCWIFHCRHLNENIDIKKKKTFFLFSYRVSSWFAKGKVSEI